MLSVTPGHTVTSANQSWGLNQGRFQSGKCVAAVTVLTQADDPQL